MNTFPVSLVLLVAALRYAAALPTVADSSSCFPPSPSPILPPPGLNVMRYGYETFAPGTGLIIGGTQAQGRRSAVLAAPQPDCTQPLTTMGGTGSMYDHNLYWTPKGMELTPQTLCDLSSRSSEVEHSTLEGYTHTMMQSQLQQSQSIVTHGATVSDESGSSSGSSTTDSVTTPGVMDIMSGALKLGEGLAEMAAMRRLLGSHTHSHTDEESQQQQHSTGHSTAWTTIAGSAVEQSSEYSTTQQKYQESFTKMSRAFAEGTSYEVSLTGWQGVPDGALEYEAFAGSGPFAGNEFIGFDDTFAKFVQNVYWGYESPYEGYRVQGVQPCRASLLNGTDLRSLNDTYSCISSVGHIMKEFGQVVIANANMGFQYYETTYFHESASDEQIQSCMQAVQENVVWRAEGKVNNQSRSMQTESSCRNSESSGYASMQIDEVHSRGSLGGCLETGKETDNPLPIRSNLMLISALPFRQLFQTYPNNTVMHEREAFEHETILKATMDDWMLETVLDIQNCNVAQSTCAPRLGVSATQYCNVSWGTDKDQNPIVLAQGSPECASICSQTPSRWCQCSREAPCWAPGTDTNVNLTAGESLSFSPDGQLLALVAGTHDVISIVDAGSGDTVHSLSMPGVQTVSFSPDGRLLAAAAADDASNVLIWNASNWEPLVNLSGSLKQRIDPNAPPPPPSPTPSPSPAPHGGPTGDFYPQYTTCHSCVQSYGWCVESQNCAGGSSSGPSSGTCNDWIWDTDGCPSSPSPASHSTSSSSMMFTPDGKFLLAVQRIETPRSDTVTLWNTMSWDNFTVNIELNASPLIAKDVLGPSSFSPDGKYFATMASDKPQNIAIRTSGMAWGTCQTLEHAGTVGHTAFSTDGKHMASSSSDGTVKIWDTSASCGTWTCKHTLSIGLPGQWASGPRSVASTFTGVDLIFSPHGYLITSMENDFVRLWNIHSGDNFRIITNATARVALSSDGKLASTGILNPFYGMNV